VAAGDWWRHGVIYQIYPRSFADADGDGIGDLAGITARLDHLNDGTPDSLGVDAIWLGPFYRSPMKDFGYDVSDYRDVDPMFGTLADFDELLVQAHRRGIRVIVDLVPNHTSDQHPWFVESRSSRGSPRRGWYVWADPAPGGGPPNNWRSSFPRVGPAWTLDAPTGQYYLHGFLPEQPDLNWWNPEVREAIEGVMRFWLDRGVDGFRIDVAHRMARDPELADNPLIEADEAAGLSGPERLLLQARQRAQLRDSNWPEVHEILRRFRRLLDRYDDRMAVGEVYLLDQRDLVRYYGDGGDELHLAHNFVFLHQPWRADRIRQTVDEFEALLPEGAWPDYFTGNHDHSRVATRCDEGGNGRARARAAAVLLLTLRGTPFVYQGEEIGMTDVPILPEQTRDIDGRDPERTPMQWDAGAGAGFTTGVPWLPVGADHRELNVAAQRDDPASMLSLYRRLIRLRRASPALHAGGYRALDDLPESVFAYLREAGEERLLVALQFGDAPVTAKIVGEDGPATLELSTDPGRVRGRVDLRQLALGPNEAVVVRLG
jgi:alpha-glucosidase